MTGRVADVRGVEQPGRPVHRIVSLVPSLTATVADLGAAGRLVGRTRFCVEPPAVRAVPDCGGPKDPDVARIVALRPDLVLAAREENRPDDVAALEAAGVPVYVTDPLALDDVDRLLADLGRLLGLAAAADRHRRDLATAREAAAAARGDRPPVPVVVPVWLSPWRVVGGGTYADAMLSAAGLANVAADRPRYPEMDLAELRRRAPGLVLLPDEPYAFRPGHVAELVDAGVVADPARVLPVPGRALFWYGSRTAAGLDLLARAARRRGPGGGDA